MQETYKHNTLYGIMTLLKRKRINQSGHPFRQHRKSVISLCLRLLESEKGDSPVHLHWRKSTFTETLHSQVIQNSYHRSSTTAAIEATYTSLEALLETSLTIIHMGTVCWESIGSIGHCAGQDDSRIMNQSWMG